MKKIALKYVHDTQLFPTPHIKLNDSILGDEGSLKTFEETELQKD